VGHLKPLGGPRRTVGGPGEPASTPAVKKSLSVLVVEDNEINALLSRALLTRLGHRPTVATDGAAALETWQAARAAGRIW